MPHRRRPRATVRSYDADAPSRTGVMRSSGSPMPTVPSDAADTAPSLRALVTSTGVADEWALTPDLGHGVGWVMPLRGG